MDIEKCYIGDEILDCESGNIVCVRTENGIKNVNGHVKRRALSWRAVLKQRLHKRCRENHMNKKTIPSLPTTDANKATTRLSSPAATGKFYVQKFDYRTCCLFCTEKICKRCPGSVEILSHKKEDKKEELTASPYTARWIKTKLSQHYGESIVISNMKGCTDSVYFRNSANNLLYEFYKEGQNNDIVSEKEHVIKLAANLIKKMI